MPPEWFWKGLTIIIAAWAAWSAWQQHHVARDKLRLDLFEKRQELFEAVQRAIIATHDLGKFDPEDLRRAALRATFLFGSDVSHYLTELRTKLTEYCERPLSPRLSIAFYPTGATPAEILLLKWVESQPKAATAVFAPYLSFAAIRRSKFRWRI